MSDRKLLRRLARLEGLLAALIAWMETRSIMKLPRLLGQLSVLTVAITYIADAPKRRQIVIDDALKIIQAAENEPFSEARSRGLMVLKDYCISATGLRLENAELAGIDLGPCKVALFEPAFAWPPYQYEIKPFDLSHARLAGANLRGAHFEQADLRSGADLRGAHLRGALLDKADLGGANLQNADLHSASMRETRLIAARIDAADLSSADLTHADMTQVSSIRTNFIHASLVDANLTNSDLAGADMEDAVLFRTNLAGARMVNTRLERTARPAPSVLRVALLILDPTDSFFVDVQAGIESFLRQDADHSAVLSDVRANQANPDVERQAIEALIRDKVDAIVLSPVNDKLSRGAIEAAYEAGIVLVCYNNCSDDTEMDRYFSGRFDSDQVTLGRLSGAHLAGLLGPQTARKALHLGTLNCGGNEECASRYFGFQSALSDAGIKWRLTGTQEGWNARNAPDAAARLLADDPNTDILWAANGPGTEAIARAAGGWPRTIQVVGTDMTPEIQRLLEQKARNPLRAVASQSPRTMGECSAAAALARLRWLGTNALPDYCRGPMPIELHTHS